MNIKLEKIEGKMFQCFPLRTDIIPKFIPIDTKSIIEILVDKDKNNYLKDIENTKQELWNKFFNINVKMKDYLFEYTIITDCYSASIRFIHKDFLNEELVKKDKMRNARQEYKGLTKQEKEKLKAEKKKENKKLKKLQPKVKKIKYQFIEFPYIDEVDKKQLKGNHIFIDPGKRDLLSIIDNNGNKMTYSNKQRIKETKRLKYQQLIKNYRDKLNITLIENKLSEYNSKTCNLKKFKKYFRKKNKINEKLINLYENDKFRQYKWYSFINKKKCEDNMLNLIENKYGKDIKVIIDDWTIGKQRNVK